MTSQSLEKVGIVVIGRNEGERLKRCLLSVRERQENIVYVDSGSTDGSIPFAKSIGVEVVALDMTIPFTMARGRNTGFKHLLEKDATLNLVHFFDGDCEVVPGYIESAIRTMSKNPDVVVVTGRRVERYPNASIYNRLCNIEWGRDLGEIKYSGGDMMVRAGAFLDAGMFNNRMIAGEEPELCVRMRRLGGKIVRIDHDMTIHDAAMHSFRQWWKRSERGGHACAEGAAVQGLSAERHKVKSLGSIILWGAAMPTMALFTAFASLWNPWCVAGTMIIVIGYIVLSIKIYRSMRSRGFNFSDARLYALFCIMGKFPRMIGIIKYWLNRLFGRQSKLIEYKHASPDVLGER